MREDDAYLIDLCDAVVGEPALREHELPWLREGAEPDAPSATVDAWYPYALLIVLLVDRTETERARLLARAADGYRVDVVEVPRGMLERDATGATRRRPLDRSRIAALIGNDQVREESRVRPEEEGWTAYVGVNVARPGEPEHWPDEADDWPGEDDDDEAWFDETPRPGAPEFVADTATALGWRGRSVALAVLEAVSLSRRALAVERTGHGLSEHAFEVLLVLLLAERPVEREEVARVLTRPLHHVERAVGELQEAGHVESLGGELAEQHDDVDFEWTITAAGRDVAVDWIARTLPLFGGWPPDVPGADDATG